MTFARVYCPSSMCDIRVVEVGLSPGPAMVPRASGQEDSDSWEEGKKHRL